MSAPKAHQYSSGYASGPRVRDGSAMLGGAMPARVDIDTKRVYDPAEPRPGTP
jgi:hypothetical protein